MWNHLRLLSDAELKLHLIDVALVRKYSRPADSVSINIGYNSRESFTELLDSYWRSQKYDQFSQLLTGLSDEKEVLQEILARCEIEIDQIKVSVLEQIGGRINYVQLGHQIDLLDLQAT